MADATVLESAFSSLDQGLEAARKEIARNDPQAALAIWSELRQKFPDNPIAYLHAALVLTKLARHEEAETLLCIGRKRFADHAGFIIEHAWAAHNRGDLAEAIRHWEDLRGQFPDHHAGYTGAAISLRSAGRLDDADEILVAASARFPNEPAVAAEYARLAHHERAWPEAISRWENVRQRFPDQQAGYIGGATALRETGRFEEAEDLLQLAMVRLPDDLALMIERAWLAHHRGDHVEAIRRWEEVRRESPAHHAGYTGAAASLRSVGRFDDADQILVTAAARFPNEPMVAGEHAWLANHRRDWAEAVTRWEAFRQRFPNQQGGYTAGSVAFRELGRFEEAEALLQSALERFPGEQAPIVEHAWLAVARRDWPEAIQRWGRVRKDFPEHVEGYLRGASALTEMRRYEEAEALLSKGMRRFPDHRGLLCDHAWLAVWQRHEDEALERFGKVRKKFPNIAAGYLGEAHCRRNQHQFREAEEILERGHVLVPDEPRILLDHAQIPISAPRRDERNYDEALRRLETLQAKFPQFEEGYISTIRLLRDDNRLDEADTFGAAATLQLPHSSMLAVEHAHSARARADWPTAIRRYADVSERFPRQPAGMIGLASALSGCGKHVEAEAVLREAMKLFPTEKAAFSEFAAVAARQSDWKEALTRWLEASRRFPHEKEFAQHIFETRLRLLEDEATSAEAIAKDHLGSGAVDANADMRDLMLKFESLGGTNLGCEFGLIQREYEAEPLGLLRWTDIKPQALIDALVNRFEGVGDPENTRLIKRPVEEVPEYATADNRYGMVMHTFVHQNDVAEDEMFVQSCRRLRFLREKFVEDLEAANKIFVYKITDRNLTKLELSAIHLAMRAYGDTTLLYVRYADPEHPNGTVEAVKPGLMVGYIDRFGVAKGSETRLPSARTSWSQICRRAFELWKSAEESPPMRVSSPAIVHDVSEDDDPSGRDLAMQFESLGGSGHGYEFGIFQRSQGAEPLGLLRWADMGHDLLTEALENQFEGVGSPEYTEIFVPANAGEYWTTDKRYHMAMRSFIKTADVTLDKITRLMHRRLQFLRTKLIEDLVQGTKIFVYKNMFRNLTDAELTRLHAAVRSYGNNTLFYVRYETPIHPNGAVETPKPGLMIGYIDHFAYSPADERLEYATPSWLTLCHHAYWAWIKVREQVPA